MAGEPWPAEALAASAEPASRRLLAAKAAALTAGRYLLEQLRSGQTPEFSYKGEINIVTVCDREAQRLIVEALRAGFPAEAVLAEEDPVDQAAGLGSSGWIVDPLDGTTNFARKLPHFCVSIAYHLGGEVCLGVVYTPVLHELFWAERGSGAYLNTAPIRVTGTANLKDALTASGFPYDLHDQAHDNLSEWAALTRRVRATRCAGAAALDLCYAACGRYDAFWEMDLDPWDMAAGSLIVTEAGGIVTTARGQPFTLSERSILASNPALHTGILAALHESRRGPYMSGDKI